MTKEQKIAYLCLLPSLVLMGTVIFYPICNTFVTAFYRVNPFGMRIKFWGWMNFIRLFSREEFWSSLYNTFIWTGGVVGFTVIWSLGLSLVLNEKFKGRSLTRGILLLPWATSLIITALIWRWILNPEYGLLNHFLSQIGLLHGRINWVARWETSFPMMIWIGILVSIPFTTTVFLAGLQAIPLQLYEAANVEGAGSWARFRYITMPLLKPVFTIALLLNVIYVFNSFPIIWAITGGDPADTTHIIVTYLYKVAFFYNDFGLASAMALIVFIILLSFSIIYTMVYYKGELY